jgi:hypothetical protein
MDRDAKKGTRSWKVRSAAGWTFGGDEYGYEIVSQCDRSIERGRGEKATSAGRQTTI